MPRKIFDLSRFRGRQPQHKQHRDKETETETTGSGSHDLHSMALSKEYYQHDLIRSFSADNDIARIQAERLYMAKPVVSTKNSNAFKRSPPPAPRRHHQEHPPSQVVVLELQSSVDFLNTKLQQSESEVKALKAQNSKLESIFQKILEREQETHKAVDGVIDEVVDDASTLLDRLLFLDEEEEDQILSERENCDNINSGNGAATLFTHQDALEKIAFKYKAQADALLTERGVMQRKMQQLKAQNKVQAETMASLEQELCNQSQEQEMRYNKSSIHPSSSHASAKTPCSTRSRRSMTYKQQVKQQQVHARRSQTHRHSSQSSYQGIPRQINSIKSTDKTPKRRTSGTAANWTNMSSRPSTIPKPPKKGIPSLADRIDRPDKPSSWFDGPKKKFIL